MTKELLDSAIVRNLVGVCDAQPATAEGVRALLAQTRVFECHWIAPSLTVCLELLRRQPANLVLLDKGLGFKDLIDTLAVIGAVGNGARPIVWGSSLSESETLRLFQAGAQGVMRKSADAVTIIDCLATVAAGRTWVDDAAARAPARINRRHERLLTLREQQVLELVEQGMKNREIAGELGIRPGTVKIHLKHIFEKTGIYGRFGLVLNGLRVMSDRPLPACLPPQPALHVMAAASPSIAD